MAAQPSPMEELLGKSLLTDNKGGTTTTAKAMKDKDLVALYFSASWCPPCKAFSPILSAFYAQFHKTEKLEIIYISSDKTAAEFVGYFGKMPWLALPNDERASKFKSSLATKLQVQGIPSLFVLDAKTGLFVTSEARNQVQGSAGNTAAGKGVIDGWKAIEPMPIEDGLRAAGVGGPFDLLKKLMFAILKNPIYIFGSIYMFKYAVKKLAKGPMGLGDDPDTEDNQPLPDDEF